MASLHSQWEIVPIELPNPEETQIWELLLIIATFIWQARIGCHVNGLTDIQKKPQNPVFDNAGYLLSETAVREV